MEEGNDQPRGGDRSYTLSNEAAFLQTDDEKPAIIAEPPPDPAQFNCWFCRAALEAGTDPAVVQQWIAEVTAARAAAEAQLRESRTAPDGLTAEQVRALLEQAGGLVHALDRSDPTLRAQLYEELGISGVYDPNRHTVQVQVELGRRIGRVGGGT